MTALSEYISSCLWQLWYLARGQGAKKKRHNSIVLIWLYQVWRFQSALMSCSRFSALMYSNPKWLTSPGVMAGGQQTQVYAENQHYLGLRYELYGNRSIHRHFGGKLKACKKDTRRLNYNQKKGMCVYVCACVCAVREREREEKKRDEERVREVERVCVQR